MNSSSHHGQITRTATIKRHVDAMLAGGRTTQESFAAAVVDHFNAAYSPAVRGIKPFADTINGDPLSKVLDTNRKRVARYLDECLPANLEESVVACLSEPYRSACVAELAARYDLLPSPIPSLDGVEACHDLCRAMRECAEAIQAASGRADPKVVIRETHEAIGALLTIVAAHSKPGKPALKVAG